MAGWMLKWKEKSIILFIREGQIYRYRWKQFGGAKITYRMEKIKQNPWIMYSHRHNIYNISMIQELNIYIYSELISNIDLEGQIVPIRCESVVIIW